MIVHQSHNSLGNYSYNAFFYDNCEWFYHFHKNYELIYVCTGEVELTLDGKAFLLQAEQFALILPNQFHAYHTPVHSRAWVGVFSADFVGEFAKLTEGKQAHDPRFTCDEETAGFLRAQLICEESRDLLTTKALLYAACGEFYRQAAFTPAREQALIWELTSYVSSHFREDLTFSRLAEALGYEYHYLSRLFHRHFGMGFKQFLNTYRMDYAREQLLLTDHSITDIAYSAGFQTVRTFNRVFTEHTGMTPSQFRRTHPRLRRQRQNSDGSFYYTDD